MNKIVINENEIKKNYTLLVKHNNLIQCKYYLDSIEQKLLYKIFEDVQKKGFKTKDVELKFQDFYRDFKDVLNKNISRKEFIKMLEELQVKMPYIFKKDGTYVRTQWYKIKGKIDHSEVKLTLDDDVFEYIQSLDKGFTKLKLDTLYSFKSFYTMRIYELIKQWINTKKEISFEPNILRELLGINEIASYKNYTNFKKRVIESAVNEINEKSELKLEVVHDKQGGKSVKEIKFLVLENKDAKVANNSNLENNEDNNTNSESNEDNNTKDREFEIPTGIKFDSGYDNVFHKQFNKYDFDDPEYYLILLESRDITLERDKLPKNAFIGKSTYRFFKDTLTNKIKTYEGKREKKDKEDRNNKLYSKLTEEQQKHMFMLGIEDVENYLEMMDIII